MHGSILLRLSNRYSSRQARCDGIDFHAPLFKILQVWYLHSTFLSTQFIIELFMVNSQAKGQTLTDQNIGHGWSKNSSPFSRTPRVITDPGSAPFAPSFESIPSFYLTQHLSSRYYGSVSYIYYYFINLRLWIPIVWHFGCHHYWWM